MSTIESRKSGGAAPRTPRTATRSRLAVGDDACSTLDVARQLGLAVRSVQLMVDRGELQAWKTPGGHRRIARASVDRWLALRRGPDAGTPPAALPTPARPAPPVEPAVASAGARAPRVLLIEDSRHFQNLVTMLVRQHFPQVDLQVADDGINGLVMAGEFHPDVLLVDILLPGIDGGALITSLRLHPSFGRSRLIVVTSLEGEALDPYRFALGGVPVVHKPLLVAQLPALLREALAGVGVASAAPAALR